MAVTHMASDDGQQREQRVSATPIGISKTASNARLFGTLDRGKTLINEDSGGDNSCTNVVCSCARVFRVCRRAGHEMPHQLD